MQFNVLDLGFVDLPEESVLATTDLESFHHLLLKEGRNQGLAISRTDIFEGPPRYQAMELPEEIDQGGEQAANTDTLTRLDRASIALVGLTGAFARTKGKEELLGTTPVAESRTMSRREQLARFGKGLGILGGVVLFGAALPSEGAAQYTVCGSCGFCRVLGCCGCEVANYRRVYVYSCRDEWPDGPCSNYCSYYWQFCG
jgi:hypothetical protein